MTKLKNLKLSNFLEMTESEMKNVVGGYSGSSNCYSENGSGHSICTSIPGQANAWSDTQGGSGYWCCNCAEARSNC